jgi:hypothetical protein
VKITHLAQNSRGNDSGNHRKHADFPENQRRKGWPGLCGPEFIGQTLVGKLGEVTYEWKWIWI